ncbi:TPA: hypothetical protein U2M81_001411 [Acinetobacter nosocomialis]|nr:hypothetical protein [Acinetobacter nosocomialis]HEM8326942.1 hypothetical protein [Acinetobacter nosocomialis]
MDKKALQEQFEEFARWYVLPLDKSEDGIYRALETQSAWAACQHQQAKVEELQKRMDAALKKLDKRRDELWSKWKEQADMQDQGAANAFEEAYWILEQALKGEGK